MVITEMSQELFDKWVNATAIDKEGEDGSLYLATVCSMAELAFLSHRAKTDEHKVLVHDAKLFQESMARHGKEIRIV